MFSATAELYDVIYGQFKNYSEESDKVAHLIGDLHPTAETLLDVACGTGEHALHLTRNHGFTVDGIDIERRFVELAQEKNPTGNFLCADMTDFELGRRYDAILCLFSSIGYAKTLENVTRALRCFRRHLARDGVVVVEPWFEPEVWETGRVFSHLAEGNGVKVCRMSHSTVESGRSVLDFHYLVGREEGVEHVREVHELGLFTRGQMEECFVNADLEIVRYDAEGLIGRGLYIAR